MRSITMTDDQQTRYDADDETVMTELNKQAQRLADETGETVEIYTQDRVVANVRSPD